MAFVVYLTKTTEDFVVSPRSALFLLPVFVAVLITYKGFNSAENGIFKGSLFLALSLLVVFVILKFGLSIEAVSESLRSTIKYGVENFTGMVVNTVNVHVVGIRI